MVTLKFYNDIRRLEVWQGDQVSSIQADCVVRNELNGWRPNPDKDPASEVRYAITHDPTRKYPIMPRSFPIGRWEVYMPVPRSDEYLTPYYIPTNAEQWLEVWDIAEDGGYGVPTGQQILDIGYGLHCSQSNTTVGCIKIYRESDLLWLRNVIMKSIDLGNRVWLEA